MQQYLYALSIVSHDKEHVNNGLYSGLCDAATIIQTVRNIPLSYDPSFAQNVSIITCNLAQHHGDGRSFQFRRAYSAGRLENCLEDIIGDIQNGLINFR